MKIGENWHGKDRGVSPVIAVILMVAITVILSAVIGTFVLDMSDKLNESPPSTQFDFEQNTVSIPMSDSNGNTVSSDYRVVNITHVGGEQIEKSNLRVTVAGIQAYAVFDVWWHGEAASSAPFEALRKPNQPVAAGDTTTLLTHINEDAKSGDTWTVSNLADPSSTGDSRYKSISGGTELKMANTGGPNPGYSGVYSGKDTQLQPGETVRVIWDTGEGTGTILAEYEIKDNS